MTVTGTAKLGEKEKEDKKEEKKEEKESKGKEKEKEEEEETKDKGSQEPKGCDGTYTYTAMRNGFPCFSREGANSGVMYFDGKFWKISRLGKDPTTEGGWVYSQQPSERNSSFPPQGSWDTGRHVQSEMYVDYEEVTITVDEVCKEGEGMRKGKRGLFFFYDLFIYLFYFFAGKRERRGWRGGERICRG